MDPYQRETFWLCDVSFCVREQVHFDRAQAAAQSSALDAHVWTRAGEKKSYACSLCLDVAAKKSLLVDGARADVMPLLRIY